MEGEVAEAAEGIIRETCKELDIVPTQKKFDELMKRIKRGEFKYQPKESEKIDWSKYDRAQINEMNERVL